MNEGTPTWRVDKDRERVEHECEERAREEAERGLTKPEYVSGLVSDLDEGEQHRLGETFAALFAEADDPADAANKLFALIHGFALRRALAAERRKEGLE